MRSSAVALFFVLGLMSSHVSYADSLEPVQAALAAAKSNSTQFYSDGVLPDSVRTGAAQSEAARQAVGVINSPQYQQKVAKERDRLQQDVYGIAPKPKPYYEVAKEGQPSRLAADERIYLFVSASIPEATLRAYVQDIDQLRDPNIIIVLRGFIGGMKEFKPTMKFINDLLKKDRGCEGSDCATYQATFEIDPNLYRRFKPTQVPALVYAREVAVSGPGVSEGIDAKQSTTATNPWWMIYGDASLSYLLSRVSDDTGSPVLAAFSDTLKKN